MRRPQRRNTSSPTSSPRSPNRTGPSASMHPTAEDSTQYFWSMPSNRLELWAYLESQRIGQPSRARVLQGAQCRPGGAPHANRLLPSRPHDRAVSRHRIRRTSLPDPAASVGRARSVKSPPPRPTAFHEKYYVPSNIVIAVVGDIKASEAMPVLERYFAQDLPRPQTRTDDHR